MYIPKFYKVTDPDEIREFVRHHSFGTLVTTRKGRPIATHLPLQFVQEEEQYWVTGHMAYGNPQWGTFEDADEVLVMFQGPHAYISSSWYEQENVPTWNYQAVHLLRQGNRFGRRRTETGSRTAPADLRKAPRPSSIVGNPHPFNPSKRAERDCRLQNRSE